MNRRFNDVGRITLGKRPIATPMPAKSVWEIVTRETSCTVQLEGRRIVAGSWPACSWCHMRFEELTRELSREGWLRMRMLKSNW